MLRQDASLEASGRHVVVGDDDLAKVSKLTPGQVDCLLLVDQHLNSKEIAVRLGISPHTVDQRIRGALEKLGVDRRGEAARIVAASTTTSSDAYQRLIHQSPHIDAPAADPHQDGAVSHQIRHADRVGKASSSGAITEQASEGSWSSLHPPFATRSHPSNAMSIGQRLMWIALIAIGASFSAGMYLAGLESLSRMIGN
ncbi:helix-turn-helix transcriptional regulator [Sphingomonas sp. LY29]|uniref:response regulator transcription factor n=1 Tax=Sphingomonas sp. LY29 TaxID=3095341 RepID=UPI002D771071|nr:helix-turn-helix transcriptional regulator [Sphingomonas sp. LY29]WRP25298.1 helix-turn-helix transcriptional regulator [Sphingomonas sp. LY29]